MRANIVFKIQYGQIYRTEKAVNSVLFLFLKSNMDRFIENFQIQNKTAEQVLKSNMDRFIERFISAVTITVMVLKSNMDRFIVLSEKNF